MGSWLSYCHAQDVAYANYIAVYHVNRDVTGHLIGHCRYIPEMSLKDGGVFCVNRRSRW